jgi:hypothetical protein
MPEAAATNVVAAMDSSLSFKSVFQPTRKAAAASTAMGWGKKVPWRANVG